MMDLVGFILFSGLTSFSPAWKIGCRKLLARFCLPLDSCVDRGFVSDELVFDYCLENTQFSPSSILIHDRHHVCFPNGVISIRLSVWDNSLQRLRQTHISFLWNRQWTASYGWCLLLTVLIGKTIWPILKLKLGFNWTTAQSFSKMISPPSFQSPFRTLQIPRIYPVP